MNSKDVQNSPFVFGHSQSSENAVSVFLCEILSLTLNLRKEE